jgi:hypothetical protein
MGEGMEELRRRAVQKVSQCEIFQAMSYAAVKARAGHHEPGEIIRISSCSMVVADDDEGEGIVVQIIESRKKIEDLAAAAAGELGHGMEGWSDHERREWMASFLKEIREILRRWQQIEMRTGPGENLTFEKAVDKGSGSRR